jgi:hypothetical protein
MTMMTANIYCACAITESCGYVGGEHRFEKLRPDGLWVLNAELDRLSVPYQINESLIEAFLNALERRNCSHPAYWLMTARLTELTLICAGHYADHCEFCAAGDLLFNPRKIIVHDRTHPGGWIKMRHGRLSTQVAARGADVGNAPAQLQKIVKLEIVKPALLSHLTDKMNRSRCMAADYLESVRTRSQKIADTIGFLCAGSYNRMEDLYGCLKGAPPKNRRFIRDHLCLFDRRRYDRIGHDIRMLHRDPNHGSVFLRNHRPPN